MSDYIFLTRLNFGIGVLITKDVGRESISLVFRFLLINKILAGVRVSKLIAFVKNL